MTASVASNKPEFEQHIPVCAIGASAGGVHALQEFFATVGSDLGVAFVVILHLAPDQPSALGDIIAARTCMPVAQVADSTRLEPNRVYVIPPDRELVIAGDDLTARPFAEPRGRRSPIDMFFQSVASGRDDGIVIVMSGSGSDGALGARAIKEAGGVIFVQDPAEAEYPQMPQSAIATGLVDDVAPVARLATRLAETMRNKDALGNISEEEAEDDIRQIVNYLRRRTSHDFSDYKRATILRRVTRRMQVTRQDSLNAYYRYLIGHSDETQELFSDLLISVTSFFRDREAFDALAEQVVKPLFERLHNPAPLRVWVVGCATGEEAYSICMLLLEEAQRRAVRPTIQIFASDLDEGALARAREGAYPKGIEADVSEERLRRFFLLDGSVYRVKKELRELILFASHSALKDPPFIKLDLISCRNLLIYLQRDLQRQLFSLFHYALNPNGFLFLGSAETIDTAPTLFNAVDRDARIYAARAQTEKRPPMLPPFDAGHRLLSPENKRAHEAEPPLAVGLAHASALEREAPPSALVDASSRILHLSPTAGRFFRPLEGPFTAELPAQVRPELRVDLKLALRRAFEDGQPSLTLPVAVAFNGSSRLVAMQVAPLTRDNHEGPVGQALVFFLDAGAAKLTEHPLADEDVNREEVARLRQELSVSQDRLGASRREYEQATQELRASNEELHSVNEEYRSTAEELETSEEELQSMNEELQTVNMELKSKLETISAAHNDLQNLMAATEIGTLFLDPEFKIKLFTPAAAQYFNITAADVGRVISDFTNRLVYADLEKDAARVARTLVPIESEVETRDGRWLQLRIRPYRTVENRIDGMVLTLADITTRKLAELDLSLELQAMTRVQRLATKIVGSDRLDEPLGTVLDAAVEMVDADFGAVRLIDEGAKNLKIVAQRGFDQRYLDRFSTVDTPEGSSRAVVLSTGKQGFVEDVETTPGDASLHEEARAGGFRAAIFSPLFTAKGDMLGLLCLYYREPRPPSTRDLRLADICARQAADAIQAYNLQNALREANRRKDEFLSILAHELRNPLAPIRSGIEALKRTPAANPQTERLLEIMDREAAHLVRLVDDLLDVSRVAHGKIDLRPKLLDLNAILQQALEDCAPLIEANRHHVETDLNAAPLAVNGDPVRLSQLFANLINNAAKYTPPNGRIEVSSKMEGGDAVVCVRDTGIGVPPDMLPHLFELFFQVDRDNDVGQRGIGVGLALARSLVRLHGGSIDAFSEGLGKGAQFVVRLPLADVPPIGDPPKSTTTALAAPSRRVLVVDDNHEVADSFVLLLQTMGAETRAAYDGESAIAAVPEFKPDIIFVDLGMPGMDGCEVGRRIRALPEGRSIVLALLSGWGGDEHRHRSRGGRFRPPFRQAHRERGAGKYSCDLGAPRRFVE